MRRRRTTARPGWFRWAGLVLLAAVLAGCAAIPDSGPVVHGRAVDSDSGQDQFQVIPNGPTPGASARDIVAGFLKAAAGFSDDHQVARGFLTPQRRPAWQPDASVLVYPKQSSLTFKDLGAPPAATPTPTPSRTVPPGQSAGDATQAPSATSSAPAVTDPADITRVSVQTPVSAELDGDGHYQQVAPGQTRTTMFTLVRVGGQWRISQLDDGILISRSEFGAAYRPFPVYYADPTGRYLVPDLHWLAGTREDQGAASLPTTLVRVLLDGPPSWLQGAVVSGAPAGTKMDVAAVVVSDQVATVDLNDMVRSAPNRAHQLLLSQLQNTLGGLSNIVAVQITVNRVVLDVPSGSGSGGSDAAQQGAHPAIDPQVSDQPVVIDAKGRLARFDGSKLTEVQDVAGLDVAGANHPAVSTDSSSAYAVLDRADRTLLVQAPGGKAVSAVHGTDLTAPSFDPEGWVWTSPAANGGYVQAAGVGAGRVKVQAPWLKPYDVVALRISRDGTRAAVAITYRGRAHLFLAGVVRDARGTPTALTSPLSQLPDLTSVKDLAWVNDQELVVLGKRIGQPEVPWVLQIGGMVHAATAVPGANSIAAGNGELTILAGTSKGTFARAGARWTKVTTARWPAFAG